MRTTKKRLKLTLLLMLTMCLLLAGCARSSAIQTTDLSGIRIDGWQIGATVSASALTGYTLNHSFDPEPNTYFFEGLKIKHSQEQQVTELMGDFMGEHAVPVQLLANSEPAKYVYVSEVIQELGSNYREGWYDREQGLQVRTYEDQQHHLQAEFIYAKKTEELVWVRVKEIR